MKTVPAGSLLDQLEGATIVSSDVEEEEGLSLHFSDGRVLVVAGTFALSIMRLNNKRLH